MADQVDFIERTLREAMSLPVDERGAFLDRACASEPRVRRLVEALLSDAHDRVSPIAAPETSFTEAETRADGPALPGHLRHSVAQGRYEIAQTLGHGGQKHVYIARDTRLQRQVVVSFMLGPAQPSRIERFLQEARATAQLEDHPNIVAVYDFGEDADEPYIVTQYVSGGTLGSLLARAEHHRLPLPRLLKIADDVCNALGHAHRKGIVHRDVKPSNIWLSHEGVAKLGDFGLAFAPVQTRLTEAGLLIGTPAYLAPEQALGESIGPRTDLYAFGVVLYEMAAGRPVFVGDTIASVISQHVLRPPVRPSEHNPEIPTELEDLILRLLHKDPRQRPGSAQDVRAALAAIAPESMRRAGAPQIRHTQGVFVGRERELDELRQALDAAVSGHGRIVLLTGEAGSGKSYTANHFLASARRLGAEIHIGRCQESTGAPPFWPWVQILRGVVNARTDAQELHRALASGVAALADLDPEVARRLNKVAALAPLESAQARFRLFDSFATFLKNVGATKPLVLFIDDLHWADEPSLVLLRFLAAEVTQARLLVVAAYRDADVPGGTSLHAGLSALVDTTTRITLNGLTRSEVAAFIEATDGQVPSDAVVDGTYRSTEGNPFFVAEVVRLLLAEGQLRQGHGAPVINIPQRVKDVIDRRLERLGRPCLDFLTIGSVVGAQFSDALAAAVANLPLDRVAELVEQATAVHVLAPVSGSLDAYAFTHALIRERLYEQTPARLRGVLHRRVAATLSKRHAGDQYPPLAEIAYHLRRGASKKEIPAAIDYTVRAGARALQTLAYEQAAEQFQSAIQMMETAPEVDWDESRCDVQLMAADALVRAGNMAAARTLGLDAAAIAERRQWPERLARAALILGSRIGGTGGDAVDHARMHVIDKALRALDPADASLRAKLMAQLALEQYHVHGLGERDAQSLEALRLAELSGDAEARVAALYARCVVLEGSEQVEERLQRASEIVALGETLGNRELALNGHYRRIRELLELCRTSEAEAEIHTFSALAETLRQPRYLWYARFCKAAMALLRGQFADTERLAAEAAAFGRRAQDPVAELFLAVLDFSLHQARGTMKQSEPAFKVFQERFPLVHWRSVLSGLYAQIGQIDKSRAVFEQLATNEFRDIPRDGGWTVSIVALCFTAEVHGDARRAEQLYSLLLPYDGRAIIAGRTAVCHGAASRWLGLAANTMGAWEKADAHFLSAIRENQKMGAPLTAARVQLDYARILIARGGVRELRLASQLLDEAEHTGQAFGLSHVIENVQRCRSAIA